MVFKIQQVSFCHHSEEESVEEQQQQQKRKKTKTLRTEGLESEAVKTIFL